VRKAGVWWEFLSLLSGGTEGQAAQPDPMPHSHPMEPRTPRGYGRKAMRVGVDVILGPAPVGTIAQR